MNLTLPFILWRVATQASWAMSWGAWEGLLFPRRRGT